MGPVTPSGWATNQGQYSEELQFQGKSLNGDLVWVVGGFGLYTHAIGRSENVYDQFGTLVTTGVRPTSRSEALYAQSAYDFGNAFSALEGLKLTTGYPMSAKHCGVGWCCLRKPERTPSRVA